MFEYVASGLSHTRIMQKMALESPAHLAIDDMIGSMQGKYGHTYSCLFNAHTEKQYGPQVNEFYKQWHKIHSDSGGLQIITQGLTITEQMKLDVYDVQSKWSDIAMSFDEIPIVLTGKTSGRNDTEDRFFDAANFTDYAKRTGENIRKQIEFIVDHDRMRCKPLLIIQGNCVDTYKQWLDVLLETIPDELHKYIGGISLGAAGLGTGPLEDIERMFSFTQLEAPDHIKNTLHILGVGSVKRLLPAVMFKRSGMLDGVHVSYDSTSHTSGVTMGHYYSYDFKGNRKFPVTFSRFSEQIMRDIERYFGFDLDPIIFMDSIRLSNKAFADRHGEPDDAMNELRLKISFGFICASILNFARHVDEITTDEYSLTEFVQEQGLNPMLHLRDVNDMATWNDWKRNFGKKVQSRRIRHLSEANNQSNLFDLAG